MPKENTENITKWESNFAQTFVGHHSLPDINFKTNFTLSNCWFGSVKLTKNADLDKCKYTD